MTQPIVLSHYHVQPLLAARRDGHEMAATSPDLGLSTVTVALTPQGVVFPGEQLLSWAQIAQIAADKDACFVVEHGVAQKIHLFSPLLNRAYSLLPTARAPTIVNAGFTMHRIVGIDPYEDTQRKIRAIAPIRGRVLDTVTGLGYTAIMAAEMADHVLTVEIDPAVLEVARLNPWSRRLFENPTITQIVGDTYEVIQTLDGEAFSRIIHDPPSFGLAGELYSGAFYRQLYRVLRRNGRLFHYIGNLDSQHGRRVAAGVVRRLKEAGFVRVARHPEAFGLVGYK